MAINLKLPELPKFRKSIKKGKIPSKSFINVQLRNKQEFSLKKNLPLLIVIGIVLLVLCKFFVFDRLYTITKEVGHLQTIQEELADANRQISSMEGLEESYAHYTTSGMTEEELSRVDRVHAMRLIEDAFLHGNISRSWNLTGNVMTLQVSGSSLHELNSLASELEENAIVERCVISSANKRTDASGNVAVTFIIYLHQPGADTE